MKKITTCIWFDDQALEAAKFYVSIFKKSKLGAVSRYGEAGPGKKGSVMTVMFTLEGHSFMGLNGGPHYKPSPGISLYVDCKTQQEVDTLWRKLLRGGGKESMCGWLEDRYGVSWQIIPSALVKYTMGKDPEKAKRAMGAMLQMRKIDLKLLERAVAGDG